MKDEERRLDGNAAGGLLGEIFALEPAPRRRRLLELWLHRAGRCRDGIHARDGHDRTLRHVRQQPDPGRPQPRALLPRPQGPQIPPAERGSLDPTRIDDEPD